ncbi:MAG: chromosome segregation protein SMC [Ignavibacteriae bacterium]|nr:chromosome segregation protein SMC [Ignavibacteriota bacterium]
MYLSGIEIIGFKSFPNKTNVKFADGLTAIVGPNGCGKTNIVDAIRWVLGEQKSSILRSEIMENVIFNGTDSRKPIGLAEVSIFIENNKNVLPVEYTDVKVTRKLFRSGESQYLLNNTQCRLRDILDLFMDTGIGADTYSVIELKMVEAILNGKPEERRHLIEEASGVTRYKHQRKEASRKLSTVESDLLRVYDITAEVQKNVNSLSRQAAKTRRYNKLLEEMKQIELSLIYHEFDLIKNESSSLESEFEKIQNDRQTQEHELHQKETDISGMKGSLDEVEAEYDEALANENSLNNSISGKNKDKAVSEEKILSLQNAKERIIKEIEDSNTLQTELKSKIENTNGNLKSANEKLSAFSGELNDAKEQKEQAQFSVNSLRQKFNRANEELVNLQGKIESSKGAIERNISRHDNLSESIESGKIEIEKVKTEISDFDNKINEAQSNQTELIKNFDSAGNDFKLAQQKKSELESKLENKRIELADLKNELNRNQAAFEFISHIVDSDETTKFLTNSGEWKPSGEKLLLAEAIGADEQHRVAVDAALGEAVRYFVTNTMSEALDGIEKLKGSGKGKASFIVRELIPDLPAPGAVSDNDGIIGWLSEIVRVDDVLRNALRAILGKTLIVNNIDNALKVIKSGVAETIVTLDGELVRSKGIIRGGALTKTEGLTVGKKERIENLNNVILSLENKISEAEEILSSIKTQFDSIDLIALGELLRKADIDKNNNEQFISQLTLKKENAENNLKLFDNNISLFNEEIERLTVENESFKKEIEDTENRLLILNGELSALQEELNNAVNNLSEKTASLQEAEIKRARLEEEIKSLEKEITTFTEQINSLSDKDSRNQKEIESFDIKTEELKSHTIIIDGELGELQKSLDAAQTKREELHDKILSVQEMIQQHTNDLLSARKQYDRTIEHSHNLDIKLSEFRVRKSGLIQKASEDYSITLEQAEFEPDENFNIEESKNTITSLKEKLGSLGNVNFMALEEFEEQSQRLEFYTKQIHDLEESKKNLQESITEINETAIKKFNDTFELIKANFANLFKTLFGPEGEAELSLTEGDPLDADINIKAKPPGKKPHSIDMLSGGEKALTAIALLFSIYLVKPSPFCILDEVDAPLDDTNIDKFINLIREFSNNTQFIIVTHSKRTMEASDYLYGITMQEKGISKIVSVRLEQPKVTI